MFYIICLQLFINSKIQARARQAQNASVAQSFSPSSCPSTLYLKQEMTEEEHRQIMKDRQKKDNHNLSEFKNKTIFRSFGIIPQTIAVRMPYRM